MRAPEWQRLGLTQEEWSDCCVAALEMSAVTGASVPPHEVAREFARARADEAGRMAALLPRL